MSTHGQHYDHSRQYRWVWIALLVLTFITVRVAYHNFGDLNIFIAMLIATVKATLVCLYFMHLKEDHRVNQVIFASSFVFLALFVALTASDLLVRPVYSAAEVKVVAPPAGQQAEQMQALMQPTPALVSAGKVVYEMQCVACHGAAGMGDGPAAAAFHPKPRNFTTNAWKQGGAPSQLFATITKGLPGTSMAPFGSLSVQDRWALVHYMRTFSPTPAPETEATLKASGIMPDASAAPEAVTPPALPVEFAIDRLVSEAQ